MQKRISEKKQRRNESNTLYYGLRRNKKCCNVWKKHIQIWWKLQICSSKNLIQLTGYGLLVFYHHLIFFQSLHKLYIFRYCKIKQSDTMAALVFLSDMQKKNLIKEVEGGYWMRLQKSQESEIIKHGLAFILYLNSLSNNPLKYPEHANA